jgi:predicted phage-related endonuclease
MSDPNVNYIPRPKNPATVDSLLANKDLTFHKFNPKDRAKWLALRKKLSGMDDLTSNIRIGGSEVAVIMGLSEYKSAGSLFYEFIGLKQNLTKANEHMFRGTVFEDTIINEYWKYYDPNSDLNDPKALINDLMENHQKGKVIREAIPLHSTVINKKYKHLLANVDSLIAEDTLGVLEIKSMYATAADRYEAGIPTQYIIQPQVYMMVLGLEYSEVFMLLDSTMPRCKRIKANKEIQENINEMVNDFCGRVMEARKAIALCHDEEEAWAIAATLEPDLEETPAYKQHLKEIWRNPKGEITATPEIEEHAKIYSKAKIEIGEITKNAIEISEIHIRKYFIDNNVDVVVMENGAKMAWRARLSIPYKKILGL